MRIAELTPQTDWTFLVVANDGRVGQFDVRPYLHPIKGARLDLIDLPQDHRG
jgi:hypothetical protein